MELFYAEITFDFDETQANEKVDFLAILLKSNWIKTTSENNWRYQYNNDLNETEILDLLIQDIQIASLCSGIINLDYAITLDEMIFFELTN